MLAIFFNIIKSRRLKILVSIILLFYFNLTFSQKASIFENITESEGLPSNYIFNVDEDQNHVLWLGTDKGLVTYQDDKWISLDVDAGLPGNYINKMIADRKNGLLIYISEKGLYYFNSNTKTLMKRYKEINEKQSVDLRKANKNENYIIIKTINFNNDKSIYYAFDRRNIYQLLKVNITKIGNENFLKLENGNIISDAKVFEKNNEFVFQNFTFEQNPFGIIRKENNKIIDTITEEHGLVSNYVSQILRRDNGDVFITTLGGGISVLKKNNPKISYLNKTISVRDIIYNQGKKYILAEGYLYILNKKSIQGKYFLRKDALSFFVSGNELILGSFEGLHFYSLEPKLRLIKTYPITTGISKILKINDKIVISTYGNGIQVMENNTVKTFENKYFNNIENMFKTKNGYAITSYEHGICLLDEKFRVTNHFDKDNGLESNFVTYAFSDNDSIYIGTKKGVTVYHNKKPVLNFNSKNGFGGNLVREIFRDKKNTIWILTDKLLYKKSYNSFKPLGSLRLTEDNKDRVLEGAYSDTENELLIVSKNKFSVFNIDKVVPNKNAYPVHLEKVTSNGELVDYNKKIQFSDRDKDIYFIFKSVDKEILTQSKLYYKINKDAWKPFSQPRSLKFYNLERGSYILSVKVINEDGYERFLEKPIKFYVTGPFYIRWWFIILSVLFASFLIYSYINESNKRKYVKRLNELRIKHQIENERKRIGRDLHDNIGAYVTSLISKIDLFKNSTVIKESEVNFDDLRLDAEHILALLRQTIFVLANKETNIIALYDNFKSYALKFLHTDNIKMIFEENIENNRKIDPTTSSGIFRIMQEALQNIHKHAHATKVEVNIISKQKIVILIKDNGKGFDQEDLKAGYGLKNMKERAMEIGFKFNVYSDITGTTIELLET